MACFSGGAPLPPEVCRQFEDKTGAILFEGYGLTETAPVATTNPTNRETRKIGTIGFPLPETMVKIMSLEDDTLELVAVVGGPDDRSGESVKAFWQ